MSFGEFAGEQPITMLNRNQRTGPDPDKLDRI